MDIYKQYEHVCEQASIDDNIFNTFKSIPIYKQILEHVTYDICISNYGFGEFDKNIQDNYVDKVLKYCNNFYIIYNTQRVHDFIIDLKNEPEDPKSGQFNTLYYK
jgi:hypothetical protein